MPKRSSKAEFIALFTFLIGATLVITNGFSGRIFAQDEQHQIYDQVEPIGDVLGEILQNYVYEPDIDRAVEGALIGIMNSLDQNSSYIPPQGFQSMREDTEGEFDGIGVHIRFDEATRNIVVAQPVPGAPAMKAGLRSGDFIVAVDEVSISEIVEGSRSPNEALEKVSTRIKGPRGTDVLITVSRSTDLEQVEKREDYDYTVTRGKIPLQSIIEKRMLDGEIGYVRISDFKKNTAKDLRKALKELHDDGMRAMVLDLRWNPGGLLNAAVEVSELFLEKNSLVTFTRGRADMRGGYLEDMELFTEKRPVIPVNLPMVVMVNDHSASSSEIVTGALQFYQRALIVGQKTYGKGSVQTIIPLSQPRGSALRLTTALYYTPAEVTIDQVGILPDIEVVMDDQAQSDLVRQLVRSQEDSPAGALIQDHGSITGNDDDEATQDPVLQRAMEILNEDSVFQNLIDKYHKDISETQRMASKELQDQKVR